MKGANRHLLVVIAVGLLVTVLSLAALVAVPALATDTRTVLREEPTPAPLPPDGIPIKPISGLTSLNATVKMNVNGVVNGKKTQGDLTAFLTTNDQGKSKISVSGSLLGPIASQIGGSVVGLFTPSKVDIYRTPAGAYVVVNGLVPICIKPSSDGTTEALDQLSPANLLSMLTNSDVARGEFVGQELRNNKVVDHYVINGDTFLTAAQNSSNEKLKAFGDALWSANDADLYLDSDGGYPVAFSGSYSGAYEPLKFEGDFSVEIELTGVNPNTRVDLPSSCNKPISM